MNTFVSFWGKRKQVPKQFMNELVTAEVKSLDSVAKIDKSIVPAYIWRTGKTFYLSKKEKLVADTFLETRSYAECARKLKAEMGYGYGGLTCKRWLDKQHIKEYMAEQMEERGVYAGWTRERWMLKMTKHLEANSRYETAKNEMEGYKNMLAYAPIEAVAGISDCKLRMAEASKDRLAQGDLYGMNLIAKVKGWEMVEKGPMIGEINITQLNGRP